MKWWQNYSDIITILIIWCQGSRKEKEESQETAMALEVVTDSKNDKTKKNE